MRLFIAVNFDQPVRDRIHTAVEAFPLDSPPWRWTRQETWHITLKFLGEVPESEIGRIERCLDLVCSRHHSFRMALETFGGFPNLHRPRVLFFAIGEGAGDIEALATDINATLFEKAGFPKDKRRFHPHITLARIKSRLPATVTDKLSTVPPLVKAVQNVTTIELMKSDLRREGAVYRRLKGFALSTTS